MTSALSNDVPISFDCFCDSVISSLTTERKHNSALIGRKGSNKFLSYSKNDSKRSILPVLHPKGPGKKRWDLFISILVVYTGLVIPYNIAFASKMMQPEVISLMAVELLIDAVFCMDVFVTFNCAYIDTETNLWEYSRQKISARYRASIGFPIDVLSSMPFEAFVFPLNQTVARQLRILKLVRLNRLSTLTKTLEELNLKPSTSSFIGGLMCILFIMHYAACLWFFITTGVISVNRTWVEEFGFSNSSIPELYVASYYFITVTMLTVGYGDIHGTNQLEYIAAICIMLIGTVVFGALVSKVSKVLASLNPQHKYVKDKMDEMKHYMAGMKTMPFEVVKEAKEAYMYYLEQKSEFKDFDILEELPRSLIERLTFHTHEYDIKSVSMFQTYKCSFSADLVTKSRPFLCGAGGVIKKVNDTCNDLIFISRGLVVMSQKRNGEDALSAFCTEGGYFGDFEYTTKDLAVTNYTAVTSCALLAIDYDTFGAALARHFDVADAVKLEFDTRYIRWKKLVAVYGNKPKIYHNVGDGAEKPFTDEDSDTKLKVTIVTPDAEAAAPTENLMKGTALSPNGKFVSSLPKIWINGKIHRAKGLELISMMHIRDNSSAVIRVLSGDISEDGWPEVVVITKEDVQRAGLVNPDGRLKRYWDFFIAICIIVSVWRVPVLVAFDVQAKPDYFGLFIDLAFCADIVVTFYTMLYEKSDQAYCVDLKIISRTYLKEMFIIDVFSSLPFDFIQDAIFMIIDGQAVPVSFLSLVKLLYLLRLFKLARILKLDKYIAMVEDYLYISPVVFDLAVMLLTVSYITHLIACGWWGLTTLLSLHKPAWFDDQAMVYVANLADAPVAYRYLISLYFTYTTVTTCGYGDITPVNTSERLLTTLLCFLGSWVFGFILANVSAQLDSLDLGARHRAEMLSKVQEYMLERSCPQDLERDVTNHYKHLYSETSSFDEDAILQRLPTSISNRIRLIKNESTIENIRFLRYIENTSIRVYIFQSMKPAFYDMHQSIISQGSMSSAIMFIVAGRAAAFKKYEKVSTKVRRKRDAVIKTGLNTGKKVGVFHRKQKSVKLANNLSKYNPLSDNRSRFRSIFNAIGGRVLESEKMVKPLVPIVKRKKSTVSASHKQSETLDGTARPLPVKESCNDINPSEPKADGKNLSIDSEDGMLLPRALATHGRCVRFVDTVDYRSESSQDTSPARGPKMMTTTTTTTTTTTKDMHEKENTFSDLEEPLDLMSLSSENFSRAGYVRIGDLYPGSFLGHVSILNQSPCDCSVVAMNFVVCYSLSDASIVKLLTEEVKIGEMLQSAIAKAVYEQEEELAKYHMRTRRNLFMTNLIDRYLARQTTSDGKSKTLAKRKAQEMKKHIKRKIPYKRSMYHSDEDEEEEARAFERQRQKVAVRKSGKRTDVRAVTRLERIGLQSRPSEGCLVEIGGARDEADLVFPRTRRRLSFPSLGLEVWKAESVSQGLL